MSSKSFKQKQLSRSKIDLFTECRRCFYDDVASGISRPSSPPYTLNIAVDALLKAEFDEFRRSGMPHRLFTAAGLDLVPFSHPDLERWRTNFTGVRWKDPQTGWTLYGAIDDVWVKPSGSVVVADYKATARQADVTAANIYDGYKRQVEVYQFLLEKQGLTVDPRAWFFYANAIATGRPFEGALTFRQTLLHYDGKRDWVPGTFRAAVEVATGGVRPEAATDCKWCQYVERRQMGGSSPGGSTTNTEEE